MAVEAIYRFKVFAKHRLSLMKTIVREQKLKTQPTFRFRNGREFLD